MMAAPIMLMKEGTRREEGKDALEQNIAAGSGIAKTVRTTLGPKGMDKMLVDADGKTIITNDGVTILKEIDVQHPAARMVVEAAKTQDEECGDGTTSAVVLIGELLDQALPLTRKKIHPTVICEGYHKALLTAYNTIDRLTWQLDTDFDEDTVTEIENIARTAMTGKHTSEYSGVLSRFVVRTIEAIKENQPGGRPKVDLDRVSVLKQPGRSAEESEIIPGVIVHMGRLSKAMPKEAGSPRIALFNTELSVQDTSRESQIEINNAKELREMLHYEEEKVEEMVRTINEKAITVVMTSKGISDEAIARFTDEGIIAVSRVPEEDLENIALLTGSPINTGWKGWEERSQNEVSGIAKLIREEKINRDPHIRIEGLFDSVPVRTILLRGASDQMLDELERGFHDAVTTGAKAYEDGEFLVGGGSVYAAIARDLEILKGKATGRELYAIEAFAKACEAIPAVLAENAGMDPIDAEIALKEAHVEGESRVGIDVMAGKVGDISAEICEPKRVVTQALKIATETASMILRIDDIIAMSPGDLGQDQGGKR